MRTIIIALGLSGALAGAIAAAPVSVTAATVSSHVAWCEQNYRSYDPATDTFTGYDGYKYRCVSPSDDTVTFGAVSPFAFVPDDSTGALPVQADTSRTIAAAATARPRVAVRRRIEQVISRSAGVSR